MKNINVGQGISKADDPYEAGKQAAKQAMEEYDGEEKPDIGFIFCSGSKYGKNDKTIEKFVKGADEGFENVEWVGCTSAGEISKEGLTKKSAVATVIQSDMMYWGIHAEEIDPDNPRESGKKAAKGALENIEIDQMVHSYSQYQFLKKADTSEMVTSDPYNMIVLAQGPGVEGGGFGIPVRLVRGVKEVIGSNPIVGGLSGDDDRALKNYQFFNGEYFESDIISIALVTTHGTSFRMVHGYQPTGKVALATDVGTGRVGELNGESASVKYANLLGLEYNDLLPKSIQAMEKLKLKKGVLKLMIKAGKNPFESNPLMKYAVTNPLGFSDENGNLWVKFPADIKNKDLIFTTEVSNNSALQVLKYEDKEQIYSASKGAIDNLKREISGNGLIFAFECYQRCMMFQEEVEKASEEYLGGKNILPLGFASYGEIGTTKEGSTGGQTLTLTTMGISDHVLEE